PATMELLSPYGETPLPIDTKQFALALGFLNEYEAVDSQIKEVERLGAGIRNTVLSETDATNFWRAYHESETSPHTEIIFRFSALPADLNALMTDVNNALPRAHLRAHAANGVIRLHADLQWLDGLKPKWQPKKIAEARRLVQSRGGQMVILRAPKEIK